MCRILQACPLCGSRFFSTRAETITIARLIPFALRGASTAHLKVRLFKASCQSTLLHSIQLTTGLDLGLPCAASQCVESPNRLRTLHLAAPNFRPAKETAILESESRVFPISRCRRRLIQLPRSPSARCIPQRWPPERPQHRTNERLSTSRAGTRLYLRRRHGHQHPGPQPLCGRLLGQRGL